MDCRTVEFSPEKSQERINKALQVFPHKVLMCIVAFTLHLLGAKRKVVAELAGMPEESVKTMVRRVFFGGFPALGDRRYAETPPVTSAPANEPQIQVQQDNDGWLVEFGSNKKSLRIPVNHQIQARTLVLSLLNAGVLSLSQSASVLGICDAHCRELARKLVSEDVTDVLVDKRAGQQQDFRVGPEQKAELIQQLAARAITGHSTSSDVLAKQVNEQTGVNISARTIRWHIRQLGLSDMPKSLPQLVGTLKKTSTDCD